MPALVLRNASIEAAKDINNYVTPCSNITAPITVAALRYVADIIEKELLDVEQAEIAKNDTRNLAWIDESDERGETWWVKIKKAQEVA